MIDTMLRRAYWTPLPSGILRGVNGCGKLAVPATAALTPALLGQKV